jgi:hypothetical protein
VKLAIALALPALCLAVVGGAAKLRPSRTLAVQGEICQFAASGADAVFYDCDSSTLSTWSAATGRKRVIDDNCQTYCGQAAESALGAAWISVYDGTGPSTSEVWFAPPGGASTRVAAAGSDVRGDGGTLVFDAGTPAHPQLWRIVGRRAVRIRVDAGDVLDVQNELVAVKRTDGRVAILRADGSLVAELPGIGKTAQQIQLDGGDVVAQVGRTIVAYSSRGTVLQRRRMRGSASDCHQTFDDARDGLVAYFAADHHNIAGDCSGSDTQLHLLRLSDGREAVIGLAKGSADRSFVSSATLTSAGLFYLDARRTGGMVIVFVPRDRLLRALR